MQLEINVAFHFFDCPPIVLLPVICAWAKILQLKSETSEYVSCQAVKHTMNKIKQVTESPINRPMRMMQQQDDLRPTHMRCSSAWKRNGDLSHLVHGAA